MLGAVGAPRCLGVVDASLQPNDLFERYRVVLGLEVASVADDGQRLTLTVTNVFKGTFEPAEVRVTLDDPDLQGLLHQVGPGDPVVAFVASANRRQADRVLFYLAHPNWGEGRLVSREDDRSRWVWEKDLGGSMYGTFNGAPEQLHEMVQDLAADRYYFPPRPFTRFGQDIELHRFTPAGEGFVLVAHDADDRLRVESGPFALSADTDAPAPDHAKQGPLVDGHRLVLLDAAAHGEGDRLRPLRLEVHDEAGRRVELAEPWVMLSLSQDPTHATVLGGRTEGRIERGRITFEELEAHTPVRGVALYDIDGDGELDVYAITPMGGRAYLQTGPMSFTDRTEQLGLAGVGGSSVSFADVDGDGRGDLLVDATVYLNRDDRFLRSDRLPADAGTDLKSAAFVDLDGDGYPDVLVSRREGGLRAYLNPGEEGGAFVEATAALGLGRSAAGAGRTGYFAPGDWNLDGRIDLFYAVGRGLLLVQQADGTFEPRPHGQDMSFAEFGQQPGLSGAGMFAPVWGVNRPAIVMPLVSELVILAERDREVQDVARYGNEVSEATYKQRLTLAADLNADGHVDLYTTSHSPITPSFFHTNRGYGSFMRPEKYDAAGFRGSGVHQRGAWSVAAGDINGDGANDLLVGGADGTLAIMPNTTLEQRGSRDHPTLHEQVRERVRTLAVTVAGDLGVMGAQLRLRDADDRVVAYRQVGAGVLTGCRGPNTFA
ncbi:MAG: VCBS repeat-containing protein, partial [Dehalococcoidia bacterium]